MSIAPRRYQRFHAYKDSGVEWLGEIPTHWAVTHLRATVTECQNGIWGDEPDGRFDVPCVRVADFDRVTFRVGDVPTIRSVDPRVVAARGLRAGNLLLEKSGGGENQPVGTVVLYDREELSVCSNFIARMPVAPSFDPRFLTYVHAAMYALRLNTKSIKQNTGIQNLDSDSYLRESVGFPELQEQRTIAAFLDHETAKIDALVVKKERLIELLRKKRNALITHAITKGLGAGVPMRDSGVGWIGQIPRHWNVKRLWHLTPIDRRIMYGIVLPGPNVDDGVPIVKGGDVAENRLRLDRLSRTTFEIERSYARSRLRGRDLVFAIRGSIGEVAMVPDELGGANLTQDAARISYTTETEGTWLLYALKSSPIFAQLESGALGATIRGINIRDLKRALLPVPPHDEQCAISSFLSRQNARTDSIICAMSEAIGRLREFRTSLISAAVTGKIDVREEVR